MAVPSPPNAATAAGAAGRTGTDGDTDTEMGHAPSLSKSSVAPPSHSEAPMASLHAFDSAELESSPQTATLARATPPGGANTEKAKHDDTGAAGFRLPPLYSFPPFFTLQTNLTTRASQLDSWTALVLDYCAHHRAFRISTASDVFHNAQLKRRFAPEDVKVLFSHMIERGRAEWVGSGGGGGGGSDSAASKARAAKDAAAKQEVWIWWKTPDEWANAIQAWIDESGQRNNVLTFYELLEGDATRGQAFHAVPREILHSALKVLAKRGKAVVFGEQDQLGVKFY